MTGRRPEDDLERLLEPDRGEFGKIYDRLSRAEPPRRLDRAVLGEATRAALGPRAHGSQRWMLGIGSVAGVVLAAGIAWQVGRELESRDAMPATASPQRTAPQVVPVQPISPPAEETVDDSAAASRPTDDRENVETGSRARTDGTVLRQKRAPVAPPPPSPAPPAPAAAPTVPNVEPLAFPPAPAEPESIREQASRNESLGGNARKDEAASLALPTDAAGDRATERAAAAEQRAMPTERPRASAAAPAPSTSVRLRRNMQLAPREWLAEISQLREQGRTQEAVENIRMFRRMHPDWPLSDELRRLAQ